VQVWQPDWHDAQGAGAQPQPAAGA